MKCIIWSKIYSNARYFPRKLTSLRWTSDILQACFWLWLALKQVHTVKTKSVYVENNTITCLKRTPFWLKNLFGENKWTVYTRSKCIETDMNDIIRCLIDTGFRFTQKMSGWHKFPVFQNSVNTGFTVELNNETR